MQSTSNQSSAGRGDKDSQVFELAEMLGFAAKGVVYVLIGVLSLQVALGRRGDTEGSSGALASVTDEPFGNVILVLLAIGLASYALWRLASSILDVEGVGDYAKGIVKRIGYFVGGMTYGALTFVAVKLVVSGGGGSGGESREDWTATLLANEGGTWLLGLIGIAIIGVGVHQLYKGFTSSVLELYRTEQMSRRNRIWAERSARIGHSARGITFGIIGVFVIRAALQSDPSETRGLGGALAELASQPYGPWLLGFVAAGLLCYGLYCFFRARNCRFHI